MAGIDSFTKLMLHCDGADGATAFPDSSSNAYTVTAAVNAQVDTAWKKFGTGAALFDALSYLTVPDSDDWNFGTGDFTIDFQLRFSAHGSQVGFIGQYVDDSNYWTLYMGGAPADTISFRAKSGGTDKAAYSKAWAPSDGTEYHIEFCRIGTTMKLFIEGVDQSWTEDTAITTNALPDLAEVLTAGRSIQGGAGWRYLAGWMDEVRVSKGIARHTANFTPPTEAYSAAASKSTILIL